MPPYVIIPARNVEKTLENCVWSVDSALTDEESKIVIVENGSLDGTADLMTYLERNMGNRLIIAASQPGKINALLHGLEYVPHQRPILFVDGDVTVVQDAFHILISQLERHPELIVVGGTPTVRQEYTLVEDTAYLNLSCFFPLSKKVRDTSYNFLKAYIDPNLSFYQKMKLD